VIKLSNITFPSNSKQGTLPSGFLAKYQSGFATKFIFTTSFLKKKQRQMME
jgi:hypothetical protein